MWSTYSASIRFITTRHEQGASFMADVYGRLNGKPGVCLATLSPGATNLMTGVADADLVIAVGYDLIEYAPKKWNPNGNTKIIHISQTNSEINKCYTPYVEVVGDISDSLYEITRRSSEHDNIDYAREIRDEIVKDYEPYADDSSFPIKPQKILYDLRQVMGEDDIVISDVGAHKMWVARHYHCLKPNTCIMSNGFA